MYDTIKSVPVKPNIGKKMIETNIDIVEIRILNNGKQNTNYY